MDWLDTLANIAPHSVLALVLFYFCQQGGDKQREAYQEQISQLYQMISQMLAHQARMLDEIDSLHERLSD
jgi:hypothetical protein